MAVKTTEDLLEEIAALKGKVREVKEHNRILQREVLSLQNSAVSQAQLIETLKVENISLKEIQELYKTK